MSKFAFIGLKQSGKSTAARMVADLIGGVSIDTSTIIYEELAKSLSKPVDEICAMPKEDIRHLLIEFGDRLCKDDPLALIRDKIAAPSYAIAGIRKRDQLEALPSDVITIWIERLNHRITGRDNLEVEANDARIIVLNNGVDLDEYCASLRAAIAPWL